MDEVLYFRKCLCNSVSMNGKFFLRKLDDRQVFIASLIVRQGVTFQFEICEVNYEFFEKFY